MARQDFDLQLTRYAERGWRANFYLGAGTLRRERHRVGGDAVRRGAARGVGGDRNQSGEPADLDEPASPYGIRYLATI
jgi:hypothetical protein